MKTAAKNAGSIDLYAPHRNLLASEWPAVLGWRSATERRGAKRSEMARVLFGRCQWRRYNSLSAAASLSKHICEPHTLLTTTSIRDYAQDFSFEVKNDNRVESA